MSTKLEVGASVGPVRIRVSASEPIKARVLSAATKIKVLGLPGPVGPQGAQGVQGDRGPTGDIAAGLPLDGGNF